jgi:alpha-amylase
MSQVCWYFQIHQPWRLRPYSLFDIGSSHDYFSTDSSLDFANEQVFRKVAAKSYRPMFLLLAELLAQYPSFRFTLSLSGVVIEQFQQYAPDLLLILQSMVKTGQVEILGETYYHSLASIFSPAEFKRQVQQHTALIEKLFQIKPRVFRNTELVYTNNIAEQVKKLGFRGMLAEGADRVLQGRPATRLYHSPQSHLPLLLKHYQLSDDVAFRFSQQSWAGWPLTAEKYEHWLTAPFGSDELINLFMDFETFGEHQWEAEGIFLFFRQLIGLLVQNSAVKMVTPSEVVAKMKPQDVFSSETPVSWADVDRDLTAWVGNPLQYDVTRVLYELEDQVIVSQNKQLIEDWRRLQTSDHFYYMCTKWASDGDVHAYFSPYGSPYDAYVNYNNVLADMKMQLEG